MRRRLKVNRPNSKKKGSSEGEQRYLIWSEEHGAWWCPRRGGYTRSLIEAGRYSEIEARKIVESANKYLRHDESFHELLIPDPVQKISC